MIVKTNFSKIIAKRFEKKPGFQNVGYKKSLEMYNTQGYTMTIQDMCDILYASRAWIDKNFVPYVKHVYLPNMEAQLYYSVSDFWQRIEDNAKAYCRYYNDGIAVDMRSFVEFIPVPLPRNDRGMIDIGKPIKYYSQDGMCSRETALRNLYADKAIKIVLFGKVYWSDNTPDEADVTRR